MTTDVTLAAQQKAEKKYDKACITINFACNVTRLHNLTFGSWAKLPNLDVMIANWSISKTSKSLEEKQEGMDDWKNSQRISAMVW